MSFLEYMLKSRCDLISPRRGFEKSWPVRGAKDNQQ